MPSTWSPSGAALYGCHQCALSQLATRADMTSDVARTYNSHNQQTKDRCGNGGGELAQLVKARGM